MGTVPKGALLLTMGIDCQADRVEWQLVGWGRDLRRSVIERGVVPGHVSEPRTRALLDDLVKRTWTNSFGRQVGVDLAAIDGNAWTEDVWGWAQNHPTTRVVMVRGIGQEWAPLFARVKKERNRAGVITRYSSRFYNFGTSILKMALYRHLAKTDPTATGFVDFPRGLDDDYFRQLTAERRQPVTKFGFTTYRWEKVDRHQANEMLDTMLQAEAAAIKLGLRAMTDAGWARLEAEREVPSDMPVPVQPIITPRTPREQAAAAKTAPPQPDRPRSPREQARAAREGHPQGPKPEPAKRPSTWSSLLKKVA